MQKGPVMPKMPPLYGRLPQLQGQLRPERDRRAVGYFVPLPEHPGEPWLGRAGDHRPDTLTGEDQCFLEQRGH